MTVGGGLIPGYTLIFSTPGWGLLAVMPVICKKNTTKCQFQFQISIPIVEALYLTPPPLCPRWDNRFLFLITCTLPVNVSTRVTISALYVISYGYCTDRRCFAVRSISINDRAIRESSTCVVWIQSLLSVAGIVIRHGWSAGRFFLSWIGSATIRNHCDDDPQNL